MADLILIVDDDASTRATLQKALTELGVHAVTCADGDQALDLLHSGFRPCLILLDLELPGDVDGWGFRQQQQADPALAGIPVVLLSPAKDVDVAATALRAAGYHRKPLALPEVLATVEQFCVARITSAAKGPETR